MNDAAAQTTLLVAPPLQSDRYSRLPGHGKRARLLLEDGVRLTLRFWSEYGSERELTVDLFTPRLRLERRCLRAGDLVLPWRDVFFIESEDQQQRFVDPRRLYDLPHRMAKELYDELTEVFDAESYSLQQSFRRAFEKPQFNRAAYTPMSWETKHRQEDTARKLSEWPDADKPHHYPTAGWQDRIELGKPEHPDYRASLASLGMSVDSRARFLIVDPRGM